MQKLKILIIGSGGREHAIGWKVLQPARNATHNVAGGSPQIRELFFAPGNGGTSKLGINVGIQATDIPKLIDFVKKEKIDLTLALPDDPLALGIVDEFQKEGLRIWGPTKAAAKIEWSKAFSKNFMAEYNLPTARFKTFADHEEAKKYASRQPLPVVIKADGLAFGKGVIIATTLAEAEEALQNIMVKKIFGESGSTVVIEEFLVGPEISIHALSDGGSYKIFPSSQDHKRIGEDDIGPNTGGMGVIAPLPFVDKEMLERIEKEIIAPTLKAMADNGTPFQGILYPSVMLTKSGPKIIEFNARFGDPEAQVYMRLLDTDFLDMVEACIDGKLADLKIKWRTAFACNIALASAGYPGNYQKGKAISGIDEAEMQPDIIVFHAGTAIKDGELLTSGGRVLGVSATGHSLEEALEKAYKAVKKISFEGMQYRKDIGQKALALKSA